MYDLNQIPQEYTVELKNRYKGLDLIESLKNYEWRFGTLDRRSDQDHPQKKRCEKGKWLSEEALQTAMKRREVKGKRENITIKYRVPKNSKEK